MVYKLKPHKQVHSVCSKDVAQNLVYDGYFQRKKTQKSGYVSFREKKDSRTRTNSSKLLCTFIHKSANLTPDLLQFLFQNNKLRIFTQNQTLTPYVSITDATIPIITQSSFPPDNIENLKEYTVLKFPTLFDVAHTMSNTNQKNNTSTNSSVQLTREDYKTAVELFRKDLLETLNTKLYTKDEDGFDIVSYKIPCKVFLKKDRNEKINRYLNSYAGDKGIDDKLNIVYYLWDNMVECAKLYLKDKFLNNPRGINPTNFLLKYNSKSNVYELKDKVIIEELEDVNDKYLILGFPLGNANMLLHDREIMKDGKYEQYREVINDQTMNYKNYLSSFINDNNFHELTNNISIYDDNEYLKKTKILGKDIDKFINNAKQIINNYLENGEYFNMPNIWLYYSWYILKYTLLESGEYSIEPALFHIREVNENHTHILKKILELSRTRLLDLYRIKSTKSLFIYTDLSAGFNFKCIYMHPLNILFRNVYFYHKIITLEDLIHTSSLFCTSIFPEMQKYKGMPFWSVVPLEIVSGSTMQLDSFIKKARHFSRMDTRISRRTNTRKQNKSSASDNSNKNNNVSRNKQPTIEEIELLRSFIGNPYIKVIISNNNQFNNYMYVTFLDISNPDVKQRICYNAIFEINLNDDILFKNVRRYAQIQKIYDNYKSVDVLGLNGILFKLISISAPIEPIKIPKSFNFKGFIQIYYQINELNTKLKQQKLKLLDGTEINNPFTFYIIIITKFIYNLFNIITKLYDEFKREPYKYYEIKHDIDEILRTNEYLNDANARYHFLYKTPDLIGLLVEYVKDVPKSKSLYKEYAVKGINNFKYTLWIIPYNNVMNIYEKIKSLIDKNEINEINIDNEINTKNLVDKLLTTDVTNLQTKLFNITSIDTPDKINALSMMHQRIKEFICTKHDITEYDLSINLNEISTLYECNLHFHYERKYTYYKPMASIDTLTNITVDNDPSKKVSIYKYPTSVSGHFSFEMLLNKMLTNHEYCSNKSLYNNFRGLLKYTGILALEPLSNL